jgi:hypothetical protein
MTFELFLDSLVKVANLLNYKIGIDSTNALKQLLDQYLIPLYLTK